MNQMKSVYSSLGAKTPNWTMAPAFGRKPALLRAMMRVASTFPHGVRIVETGTIRSAEGRDNDGWSTVAWAWLASELGGRVWTVDPSSAAHQVCRPLI